MQRGIQQMFPVMVATLKTAEPLQPLQQSQEGELHVSEANYSVLQSLVHSNCTKYVLSN